MGMNDKEKLRKTYVRLLSQTLVYNVANLHQPLWHQGSLPQVFVQAAEFAQFGLQVRYKPGTK